MVSARGELAGRDWMLWELANEFGMERPIRDYERLSDVFASWNKESRVNALMLKQTPLAISLAKKYLPKTSPTFSGYVQWEVKKGKWQKRWLELREHSLFLCKKDNGKDAAFLCSLSNFDAYAVRRVTKAPKSFVFAVKSSDSISMFENPADCVHVFCCDSDEGRDWFEKILLARSYVLYQERNVLFRTQRAVGSVSSAGAASASVQRTNTRRAPQQPLITDTSPSLPPLSFQQSSQASRTGLGANVFAEGSLLARPMPQF
ncbi:hypothetical protein FRB90_007338 [Tulasnella sp. 427]|nr:hypothetical protein FRB90_007338 [Tulasnella sp. 427]